MYFLLGTSITLALLLIANVFAAAATSGLWRLSAQRLGGMPASRRASLVFTLRALPVAVSIGLVFGYVLPAYLLHEPAHTSEVVSDKLGVIAIVSSAAVLFAFYRVVSTWVATRTLVRRWVRGADEISIEGCSVPVFRIEHEFPIIAVTGIVRSRLFIARQVLDTLEPDELAASIAHEYGHMRARDNFKRTVLRFCRDLLIVPVGRRLDHDWAESAESAADEFAAGTGRKYALDLASALIKITRIVPQQSMAAMPLATFLLGTETADITARVRALLRMSDRRDLLKIGRGRVSALAVACLLAIGIMLVLPFIDANLYVSTHNGIEAFVRLLQ